jgi:hypothetical protein
MIKFFRNIRQNLLTENKFSKYLFYAIGEVVLVVIGILIALSINNWNEDKKTRDSHLLLYENLVSDFSNRLIELEELQSYRLAGLDAANTINTLIVTNEVTTNESYMDSLLVTLDHSYIFNEEFRTLDMLFNTGIINELENKSLKSNLLHWPVTLQETMERTNMLFLNAEKIYDYLSEYVVYRNIYSHLGLKFNIPKFNKSNNSSDYLSLYNNRKFENLLVQRITLLHISKDENQILIESTKKIIELLNAELKK